MTAPPAPARLRAALAALCLLAAASCTPARTLPAGCIVDPPAGIGGPIALVGDDGAPVTEAAFAGRPALLYFGFTYCPDICPLALQTAKAALAAAGPPAVEPVQAVLISLDPERDTPEALGAYVRSEAVPPGLLGLTGDPTATAAAAAAFKVAWRRSETPESAAAYLIDHSSFFYLMDPDWRLVAMFPSSLGPEEMAGCLRAGLSRDG